MDTNHPIPQDVTGFQFRLIGNMTVKQFAYIATGGILAVLTYYAPVFFLFKAILIPIFGGTGLALAFLPIEGRPVDLMLSKFIQDVFSPTQYIYQKTGGALALSSLNIHPPQKKGHEKKGIQKNMNKQAQLTNFLHDLSSHKSRIDEREDVYLNSLFTTGATPQIISMEDEIRKSAGIELTPFELSGGKQGAQNDNENSELEKEARAIKKELEQARQQEAQLENASQSTEETHEHVNELERELGDIMTQKEQLEQGIIETQEKAKDIKKVLAPPPPTGTMNVHAIPIDQATLIGLPNVPDVPNIIIGIIKDSRGNVLPNILVEIKDREDNPVRAFKTNGLGQFASATKLTDGEYSIHFEDPKGKHKFDTISITANNTIMLPLEIISVDAREELRKELFT